MVPRRSHSFFLRSLFFIFYTSVLIPYESWALEICDDEKSRTRLIMLREGATLVGTLLAGALPLYLANLYESKVEVFSSLGLVVACLLVVSAIVVIAAVPYPRSLNEENLPKGAYKALKEALEFRVFRILLFAFCLTTMAAQIPAALILFFVEDVLLLNEPLSVCPAILHRRGYRLSGLAMGCATLREGQTSGLSVYW